MPLLYETYTKTQKSIFSVSPEVSVQVIEKPIPIPTNYLIGGALAIVGLVFVGLALKRRK